MQEGESTVETIQRPVGSRYISKEFVEEAPVNNGPDALMMWLDNNMGKTIRKQVEAPRQFLPPREMIQPSVLEDLDHLYSFQAKTISQILVRYADTLHQLAILRDPERIDREKEARKSIPNLYRNKRALTVERLQDQQLPLLQMINAFQLQPEKKIVDDLFQQAQSISSTNVIEGELIKTAAS